MSAPRIDPITLEVIRNALLSATSEMKNVVVRTAVSPLWKDAGDVSCAILTRQAELVAQGRGDIPVHLATMPFSLKGILERFPLESLEEGDVLIQNDPYCGGNTHLPDVLMTIPVFADGDVIAFSAVRGHWTDPYSATAREIFDEGIIIPPVKLYRLGQLNYDLMNMIVANSRSPEERRGDVRAQEAGCRVGVERLNRIVEKYGAATVETAMAEIIDHSERLTRAEISKLPDGVYRFTDYLDDNGVEDRPIKIEVAVTVRDSDLTIDFTGTDDQTQAGINNTFAASASAAFYVVKCVTDPWNSVTSGCYRPVEVIAPEGSLVNCQSPAPIAAYHETQVRICDALFGALAKAVPERVPAAGYGSQGGLVVISGTDSRAERRGERFVLYEVAGGPCGATYEKDGLHGTRVGTGNAGNIPVESVEIHFPVMIESYGIVPNTGGVGRYRGGCALRRVYRILSNEATVATVYERAKFKPYGLFGGQPGALASVRQNPGQANEAAVTPKSHPFQVRESEVVAVQTAGAGGYGDPARRRIELIETDVADGLISKESAASEYAVVFHAGHLTIDRDATARLRASAG